MSIAKRLHQDVVEGRITSEAAEAKLKRIMTPAEPAKKGEQMTLFGPKQRASEEQLQ